MGLDPPRGSSSPAHPWRDPGLGGEDALSCFPGISQKALKDLQLLTSEASQQPQPAVEQGQGFSSKH